MKTIAEYLLHVTSQYQNSPKFLEWLSIPLKICEDIHKCAKEMPSEFEIDNASGVQLDIIGQYLGQSRILPFEPTDGSSAYLDDPLYKKVLKLKTITNYWDGSLHSIHKTWKTILNESTLRITDNMDMSASIELGGTMTSLLKDMVWNDMVLPRPEGVRYFLPEAEPETSAEFGYDMDTEFIKGYDLSHWRGAMV